jgi:hypothetical protein
MSLGEVVVVESKPCGDRKSGTDPSNYLVTGMGKLIHCVLDDTSMRHLL